MRKTIELVLVEDETGVWFGLCDGSGPPEPIAPAQPPKTSHDGALKEFAGLLWLAMDSLTGADEESAESTAPVSGAPPTTV